MERISLGHFPTPIEKLNGLPLNPGQHLYVKRDDFSGLEVSGNKIRKLEYCLAEARALGADTIVTTGAIQSNHCRATAAASARLGFACELILRGTVDQIEGNLFLELALGASVHVIAPDRDRNQYIAAFLDRLKRDGKKPYFIPVGASNATGSFGYGECYKEILVQEKQLGIRFDAIALAVGSGGSYAGLYYENEKNNGSKAILGFAVADSAELFKQEIAHILQAMHERSGEKPSDPAGFYLNDAYVGAGYAVSTAAEIDFILNVAKKTGLILDPCYTGKAFRGLYTEMMSGRFAAFRHVLFVHTGGLFGWTRKNRDEAMQNLHTGLNIE